ncbi:MAG: hypothetical protein LBC98_07630 [Prevotellaceae bacterium]|jgi:hypothetical protein|nr:hypothetical protein [Prevotellaceae bacterium]
MVVAQFENKESIISGLKPEEFSRSLTDKRHLRYLENLLKKHDTQTIVFEYDYVDHDYLEDYSHYYSKCFKPYPKKCTRVHFFSIKFDSEQFKNIISCEAEYVRLRENLQAKYLGFVVFKPIPLTVIGKTCLKPAESCSIMCPILRKYDVHLFGLNLNILSLAFQEQDNVVSACATSAVWSALQVTGTLFHHRYLSPFEITSSASRYSPNRIFPNKGLESLQMATAIKDCGLEPLLNDIVPDADFLKGMMYAYLKCGIPIIMGVQLYRITKVKDQENKYENLGKHAVTITGYNISEVAFLSSNKLNLKSGTINEIYVHDDQLGPFAKMTFRDINFTTQWAEDDDTCDIIAKPILLLIPVYNKIRISFDKIYNILNQFTFSELSVLSGENKEIEWDVYLQSLSDLKQNICANNDISSENKFKLLTRSFPKYIWVADAYVLRKKDISIFFDATDLENGKLFLCAIHYSSGLYKMIHETPLNKKIDKIRSKVTAGYSFLGNNFIFPHYSEEQSIYFP